MTLQTKRVARDFRARKPLVPLLLVLLPPLPSPQTKIFRHLQRLPRFLFLSPSYPSSRVGAATTMVTELIRAALEPTVGAQLTEAESTLLALGIHADTGVCVCIQRSPRQLKRGTNVAQLAVVWKFYPDCCGSFRLDTLEDGNTSQTR